MLKVFQTRLVDRRGVCPIKKNPTVTVIIATYNSSSTLKLALHSVLAQDFGDYEVWVVGDACTDDSQEIVESFAEPRVAWTNLSSNSGGQGVPNTEGIRRARGEFIAYLGHDDLWLPWHLSELVPSIRATGADLVHGLCAAFDPSGLRHILGPPGFGRTYEDHFVFPSSWLNRCSLVTECGGWRDPDKLSRGVDHELLQRIHLSNRQIHFHPRLSLLKFPSVWWGSYAPGFKPPQRGYWARIKSDSMEMERDVMIESAVLLGRSQKLQPSLSAALHQVLVGLRSEVVRIYGRRRWPIPQIQVKLCQRRRHKLRRVRGLPSVH